MIDFIKKLVATFLNYITNINHFTLLINYFNV